MILYSNSSEKIYITMSQDITSNKHNHVYCLTKFLYDLKQGSQQ